MPVLKINELDLDLVNFTDGLIEVESDSGYNVALKKPNEAFQKRVLFINIKSKGFGHVTNRELFKIKVKFRVNYEQAVIYKIIEKINFYDYIIVFTSGFGMGGIEFLEGIKHQFEFGIKRIFIIRMKPIQVNFNVLQRSTPAKKPSRVLWQVLALVKSLLFSSPPARMLYRTIAGACPNACHCFIVV